MMLAIAIVKGLHIAGVIVWGAGLMAVPLMLAEHAPDDTQEEYARVRRFTHYGYTHLLTPAAVIAVAAGTAPIFLRGVFVPWMFGKLVLVGIGPLFLGYFSSAQRPARHFFQPDARGRFRRSIRRAPPPPRSAASGG